MSAVDWHRWTLVKVLAGGSDRNEDDYSSERQVHDATAHFLCELRTTSTAVAAAAAASATAATADDDANISPQLNERARLSLGDVVATAAGRRALAAFDWLEARSSCACIGGRYMRGRWWRPPLDGEQAGVPSPKSLSVKVSSMVEGYLYEGHYASAMELLETYLTETNYPRSDMLRRIVTHMLLSSGSSSDTVNTSVDESIRIRALRFLDAMLRQHRARLCIGVWLALERDTEFGGYDDDAEEMGSLEHDKHPSGYWALLKHWNDAVKVTENNMNASSYGKSEMARRACTFLIGVLEKDMVECYGNWKTSILFQLLQNDTDSWKNTLRRTVCPLLVELVAKEQYDLVGCLLTLLLLLALDGHMDAREVRLILKSAFLDEIDGTEETLFLVLRKLPNFLGPAKTDLLESAITEDYVRTFTGTKLAASQLNAPLSWSKIEKCYLLDFSRSRGGSEDTVAYPRLVALLIQSYWMYLQRTTSSHNANEDEGRRVVGERFVTFVDRWAEIHGVTDETDRAYLAILQQSIRT